jgi:hypothetical protein
MFDRIDNKLKWVARIIFWLSVVGGGIWFIKSLRYYLDLAMHGNSLLLIGIINPIVIILSGIFSSYLIYGFGELISHVRNIDCSLKGDSNASDEEGKSQENIDGNEI